MKSKIVFFSICMVLFPIRTNAEDLNNIINSYEDQKKALGSEYWFELLKKEEISDELRIKIATILIRDFLVEGNPKSMVEFLNDWSNPKMKTTFEFHYARLNGMTNPSPWNSRQTQFDFIVSLGKQSVVSTLIVEFPKENMDTSINKYLPRDADFGAKEALPFWTNSMAIIVARTLPTKIDKLEREE